MQLGVVDQNITVMEVIRVFDRKALVLTIELLDLGSRGLSAILADEAHGHAGRLLRENVKKRHIGIRVDDEQFRFRLGDEPRDHAN